MTLMEILTAIGRKAGSWAHERAVQGILDTPPIVAQDDGVILFSMIGTAVLLPYLVAVKSLHHHLPRGKVVLLDDGVQERTNTPACLTFETLGDLLHGVRRSTRAVLGACPLVTRTRS